MAYYFQKHEYKRGRTQAHWDMSDRSFNLLLLLTDNIEDMDNFTVSCCKLYSEFKKFCIAGIKGADLCHKFLSL